MATVLCTCCGKRPVVGPGKTLCMECRRPSPNFYQCNCGRWIGGRRYSTLMQLSL